ncbi:unnamed protein product [Amoebophrya sp. A120]|nr:unnamed protein product [Amoebophrya sp. A120]|eukprot:GSA120T00013154001.1
MQERLSGKTKERRDQAHANRKQRGIDIKSTTCMIFDLFKGKRLQENTKG